MRVITLTPSLLAFDCGQLAYRIQAAGCQPALIVGVLNGGARVARQLQQGFPSAAYAEVRLSRPSTRRKGSGLIPRLLHRLPLWLCDALRMAEGLWAEWRCRLSQPVRIGDIHLDAEVPDGATILVVDDAIDTGATLLTITQYLAERYPKATVRTAVITVTTARPMLTADFALYRDHTLCRFPWSYDYR